MIGGRWLLFCAAVLAAMLVMILASVGPADAATVAPEPRALDEGQFTVLLWGLGFVIVLLAVHVVGSWRR